MRLVIELRAIIVASASAEAESSKGAPLRRSVASTSYVPLSSPCSRNVVSSSRSR